MRPDAPPSQHRKVRLADYAPPPWLIESVSLDFSLHETATRVRSHLLFRRNPAAQGSADLRLDGEGLSLIGARVDGREAHPVLDPTGLTLREADLPTEAFEWEAEVVIDPAANTALEGLYLSSGMFCTQCEAEGFRKITFFPDRPDVMATYEVRIEAPRHTHPVLLSNGELVEEGEAEEGRHYAVWRDPHPKPSYLFALVAGDLVHVRDDFTTASGRDVDLRIYVRAGDEDRCDYAMDALKRSMRWDEEVYGREYDLDIFMIVAVDDFNMGAMENKGLNIFNSRLVLASPETATDANYLSVESVIAHEYFHNWTGNRITCRDWFQLCLKEGLTVFRDQQFSEDMRSAEVLRIREVAALRSRQFREDAGPLAHPVRPDEYIEINNFYTATVYEKGAEVIRMLRILEGPEGYARALDDYFATHDGEACTIEDFRRCFERSSGRDLSQFSLWWTQAGTPTLRLTSAQEAGETVLTITQSVPPTPGQPDKRPMHMPIAIGFLTEDGEALELTGEDGEARETHVLELREAEQTFRFGGADTLPVVSALRGFSAPVILEQDRTDEQRAMLLARDSDPFNRWEAGRDLGLATIDRVLRGEAPGSLYVDALRDALAGGGDPAFLAMLLTVPGEGSVADRVARRGEEVDPQAIFAAITGLRKAFHDAASDLLRRAYDEHRSEGPYSPDATAAGRRSLANTALACLCDGGEEGWALAAAQFDGATNMTDRMAALSMLVHHRAPQAQAALDAFEESWRHDSLTLDKWVGVQASAPGAPTLDTVKALRERDNIAWSNPNRFRALLGAYASTPTAFHRMDGAGYDFFADQLAWLDPRNPQTTARMATAFETWRRYDGARQDRMRAAMRKLIDRPDCSRDLYEIVTRLLDG